MRREIGTFELCDNDLMMRDLSSAETDEVVGGTGFATVTAFTVSGAGSSIVVSGNSTTRTSGTFASAFIQATSISVVGSGNTLGLFAGASVG
jgi:hypothetical protein